jgi:hypothetical protein
MALAVKSFPGRFPILAVRELTTGDRKMRDTESADITLAAGILGGPFLGYAVAGWLGYVLAFAAIALLFGACLPGIRKESD